MTAPLRQTEPNFVKVALGPRGYDILIGRGLLADLGQRIKTLRSGVRVAIVTDETVGKIHLSAAEFGAQIVRHRQCAHHCASRRKFKKLRDLRKGLRGNDSRSPRTE